jgi:hypothetical protein
MENGISIPCPDDPASIVTAIDELGNIPEEALDDLVRGAAEDMATEISLAGREAQVKFLLERGFDAESMLKTARETKED